MKVSNILVFLCDHRATQKGNLSRHITSAHGVLDVSLVNMIFVEKEKWSWEVHTGGNHSKKGEYDTCEKCDKSTSEILFKRALWNPCTEGIVVVTFANKSEAWSIKACIIILTKFFIVRVVQKYDGALTLWEIIRTTRKGLLFVMCFENNLGLNLVTIFTIENVPGMFTNVFVKFRLNSNFFITF